MKDNPRVILATALSVLGCVMAGCSDSPQPPDVPFLASDMHFIVGGQKLVIPAVAMRGPDHTFSLTRERSESFKDTLQAKAREPAEPMKLDKLDLSIREYRYTGEQLAALEICELLKRKWSNALCRGEHRGILSRLPEKFDLLDKSRLDILKTHGTVGGERKYDQVKDMAFRLGETEIGCDKESRFCTAMVEALPGLLATWTGWSDEKTGSTAKGMAATQGAAVVQFVRRAIGPVEDQTLVNAD
jgi:hypothetical protein